MGYNFIECNREQIYLLPPSLRDWLPEEDLSWFILDAVNKMDLSEFYRKYRPDGRGQAAFEPSMMLSLLLQWRQVIQGHRETLRKRHRLQGYISQHSTRPFNYLSISSGERRKGSRNICRNIKALLQGRTFKSRSSLP